MVMSRGLGDVYKRQVTSRAISHRSLPIVALSTTDNNHCLSLHSQPQITITAYRYTLWPVSLSRLASDSQLALINTATVTVERTNTNDTRGAGPPGGVDSYDFWEIPTSAAEM